MTAKNPCGFRFCAAMVRMAYSCDDVIVAKRGAIFGMSYGVFARRREALGIYLRNRTYRVSASALRAAWGREDLNLTQAAASVGMGKRAFWCHAKDLGLPRRNCGCRRRYVWPDDFNEMWEAGVDIAQLHALIGCASSSLIAAQARRRGLSRRHKNPDYCRSNRITVAEWRERKLIAMMQADAAAIRNANPPSRQMEAAWG